LEVIRALEPALPRDLAEVIDAIAAVEHLYEITTVEAREARNVRSRSAMRSCWPSRCSMSGVAQGHPGRRCSTMALARLKELIQKRPINRGAAVDLFSQCDELPAIYTKRMAGEGVL
jgi:hypothetical protein